MRWARVAVAVAVAVGVFLLVGAFCLGVDTPTSVTVAGQSYHCADVIPAGLLVSGQSDAGDGTSASGRTPAERRLDARIAAACNPPERTARWAVWGGLGLGGLVLLAGWTVLRERGHEHRAAVLV